MGTSSNVACFATVAVPAAMTQCGALSGCQSSYTPFQPQQVPTNADGQQDGQQPARHFQLHCRRHLRWLVRRHAAQQKRNSPPPSLLASLSIGDSGGGRHRLNQLHNAVPVFAAAMSSAATAMPSQASGSTAGATNGTDHLTYLPVVTYKGGKTLRYVWDGQCISPMDEELLKQGNTHAGRVQDQLQRWTFRLRDAFLPDPKDVTPDYWEWLRWRLSQRFFSSTLQNFSTQSLLMALGLGAKKALASSAAINWLVKEGVGRVARMTVATNFGQTFDSDLKRMRFVTSLLFTGCMTAEFMTPLFPHLFVPLASLANVGRAIGLTAFVATQPAFQNALCTGGNLADLTSKNQAQHMLMDMLALAVSASLVYAFRNASDRQRMLLPLAAFPLCAAGDLYCIYHELKAVHLKTLNRERSEMIVEAWLATGKVPEAGQIAAQENLFHPADISGGLLRLSFVPIDKLVEDPVQLHSLLHRYGKDNYLMRLQPASPGQPVGLGPFQIRLPWLQQPAKVLVSLSEDARPKDILTALLEAGLLRCKLQHHQVDSIAQAPSGRIQSQLSSHPTSSSSSNKAINNKDRASSLSSDVVAASSTDATAPGQPRAARHSNSLWHSADSLDPAKLAAVQLDAYTQAHLQADRLVEEMEAANWRIKPFMLSTVEKVMYVRVQPPEYAL